MGSITCSDPGFAVLQPSFRLGKQKEGNSFILLGALFIRTAQAKPAMMSPSFFFAISNGLPSTVRVVLLLGLLGHVPCMFHMLFYSKRWTQMTGSSDWQAAWTCLFWSQGAVMEGKLQGSKKQLTTNQFNTTTKIKCLGSFQECRGRKLWTTDVLTSRNRTELLWIAKTKKVGSSRRKGNSLTPLPPLQTASLA